MRDREDAPALPLEPGQEVAIYYSGGARPATAHEDRIERLTNTRVVLASGRTFRRSDRREIGENPYRSPVLLHPDDPRVIIAIALAAARSAMANVSVQFRCPSDADLVYLAGRLAYGAQQIDQALKAVTEARARVADWPDTLADDE